MWLWDVVGCGCVRMWWWWWDVDVLGCDVAVVGCYCVGMCLLQKWWDVVMGWCRDRIWRKFVHFDYSNSKLIQRIHALILILVCFSCWLVCFFHWYVSKYEYIEIFISKSCVLYLCCGCRAEWLLFNIYHVIVKLEIYNWRDQCLCTHARHKKIHFICFHILFNLKSISTNIYNYIHCSKY